MPDQAVVLTQTSLLHGFLRKLETARGELAENLKAEVSARASGYEQSPDNRIQGREQYSSVNSVEQQQEVIDSKAEVRTLEYWVEFWTLVIKHDIPYTPTRFDFELAEMDNA